MIAQKVTMQHNIRFMVHGAVVTLVYMTIVSSLDEITKLVIVCGLIAVSVIIERRAQKR
jgi:hypothetical protein